MLTGCELIDHHTGQDAAPKSKRLREEEEESELLSSLSPKAQAEKLGTVLLESARYADDEYVQAYVGLYDDLLNPPAGKMVG